MNLKKARIDFQKGYFSTNDRQPKTMAAYECDLRQFERFVGFNADLMTLGSLDIENWAADLRLRKYSPASIRRKLVVLKVFFGYWIRNGHLSESPFWRVRISVGKAAQLPRTLTQEEITALLEFAHRIPPGNRNRYRKSGRPTSREFLFLRNKAIIELLFATGVRVGELSSIDLGDFIEGESAFRIRGKGRKERLAFVVDRIATKTHEEYLKARRSLANDCSALFVNALGNRLSPQGVANVIRKFQEESGLARRVTPHMLRHTVATFLLRNGADIRVVQEFLGHASIATTQRYTQVAKEHLLGELVARHPSLDIRR